MDLHGCAPAGRRRVMVVADAGRESAAALEWALSHAVLDHDDLILLHAEPPISSRRSLSAFLRRPSSAAAPGSPGGAAASDGDFDFLDGMRAACEAARTKVRVRIERVEVDGKDKAVAILAHSKAMGVELLVIGQRRSLSSAILGYKRSASTSTKGMDIAEFLIENSKCLCVGVQKKGQNAGYLLNTKTHKNFWLLA